MRTLFPSATLFALMAAISYSVGQPLAATPETLKGILDPAAWKLAKTGAGGDYMVTTVQKETVLLTGTGGLSLTSTAPVKPNSELVVRFRMTSPENKGCTVTAGSGFPKPEAATGAGQAVYFNVPAGPDIDYVTAIAYAQPGEPQGLYVNYWARSIPKNRLTWPEATRRRAEADFAATPTQTQRWMTLRYVFRPNGVQAYIDDRLMRDAKNPKLDPAGFVKLTFTNGAQIASVTQRDLPAEDIRFEPVQLGGYANANTILGGTLKRDGLPASVGGVPFALATPTAGNDHIDLKPSWLQCGNLEGGFDPSQGDSARWRGTFERDPARIQLRVRNAQYTKLHVLAAASGEPDTAPVLSAIFYRAHGGFPVPFSTKVPVFTAPATAQALPVTTSNGKGNLYLVTIPLEPDGLSSFSDQDHLEFELTKAVQVHRSFPDPIYYSQHGAGLPSGVHVYGVTLERPAVTVDLQPDRFAHIFTAPEVPSYTVKCKNISPAEQSVNLVLTTTSHDGQEKTSVLGMAKLTPGVEGVVPLKLALKKYGYHAVELKITSNGEARTIKRSLAYLHPDTRERGDWSEGKGQFFGFWDWGGGHVTPAGVDRWKAAAAIGIESAMHPITEVEKLPAEEREFLLKKKFHTPFLAYQLSMGKHSLGGAEWDPKKPAEMKAALLNFLKESAMAKASATNTPELAVFFAEPLIGPVSYMSLPEYYGDPPYQMTPEERASYQRYYDQFVFAAKIIKEQWPNAKCLLPWGLPTFSVPFLRESKEATALMDGPAVDIVLFERMPEMQMHQVTYASLMWQFKQEWAKAGKPPTKLIGIEGPAVGPVLPGALTAQQESDHSIRGVLLLAAYGVTRHLGWPVMFHCASHWGETHYGGGLCDRIPTLSPRPGFSAYATMTRHLNRANYVKMVPTGSTSVFCLQFQHYKTKELIHVVWTLRGTRPVRLTSPGNQGNVIVYDPMDNPMAVDQTAGIGFKVGTSPLFIRGMTADPVFTLGEPDHSDAKPAAEATELAKLGDGTWKQSAERDSDYEDNHIEFVKRFPGKFTVTPTADKSLTIHLEKQEKERKTMPFYTTLVPPKPITIPGKASHLGLWVKAAGDWGRMVYCLRDAKGERWLSIGKKNEWNVDDVHNWSAFNYDGKRYLRFGLPSNAPYDLYREADTSFWGYFSKGEGDGIVDLPLTLEKVIVERRTHVIVGTEQVLADPADVVLGDLIAEYVSAADKTDEAVRLSKLRMPLPTVAPDLANPIAKLTADGVAVGPAVTKVTRPEREYDGTRCHVHFASVAGAKGYDVWVSTYADGRGAIQLATAWKEPGQLLTGLSANTDLYLFVTVTDAAGKVSKPSAGFKVNLKDMFPQK